MIVGIDEVGRGAWAGPLAVGAVILGDNIDGLTDSKKLTKNRRQQLDLEIRQKALAVGIGWVSAKRIDKIGLSQALKLAARRAMYHIKNNYDEIIIDGTAALIDDPKVTLIKKADLLIPCVSAASIVAKVARDNYMVQLGKVFPEYSFSKHVGYGTLTHKAAIKRHGISSVHRLSFAPLSMYSHSSKAVSVASKPRLMTTKTIGNTAEDKASDYLITRGHLILERNWRTKVCEIDIVSVKADTVYFTEVKFRKNDSRGGGLAAVTARKVRQMKFAAGVFAASRKLKDSNLKLAVIEVSGKDMTVTQYLELV